MIPRIARSTRQAAAALLVLLALELAAPAFVRAQTVEGVGAAVPGYGLLDWLGLGMRLALVVLAIWAAVGAMRWYVRRVNSGSGRLGRQVQVLESRALGPNRALHLVRLGGRAVLLGVTAERISPLLTIEDAEEVERLVEASTVPAGPLQQVAGSMTGLATATLARLVRPAARPAAPSSVSARRPGSRLLTRALVWLNPLPPRRSRVDHPAPSSARGAAPAMAMQRVRAASAYGQAAALAAAQHAITEAQRSGR